MGNVEEVPEKCKDCGAVFESAEYSPSEDTHVCCNCGSTDIVVLN